MGLVVAGAGGAGAEGLLGAGEGIEGAGAGAEVAPAAGTEAGAGEGVQPGEGEEARTGVQAGGAGGRVDKSRK